MIINANSKTIPTVSIDGLFIQGETNADILNISIDRHYNNIDLAKCNFIIKGVNSLENQIEQVLIKEIDTNKIILKWQVSADFTAVAGEMELEIRGFIDTQFVIKYLMPAITIKQTPQGVDLPVPDLIEQATNQMQEQVGVATDKAQTAGDYYEKMKGIAIKTPYIQDGYWWVYNTTLAEFVNSGVKAQGEQGTKGDSYNLTSQDKLDIAGNVTAYVSVTQSEYNSLIPNANLLYIVTA